MNTIPDPVELMESRMERQIDLVDAQGTYPCCRCGRRFDIDTMNCVSPDPSSPLECGRDDCADAGAALQSKAGKP